MKVINWIALILVIIGALNWGMIGFFNIDVISGIFSNAPAVARVIFAIVGLAGLWAFSFFRIFACCHSHMGKGGSSGSGGSCCR